METVFLSLTKSDFQDLLSETVNACLQRLSKQPFQPIAPATPSPDEYITRKAAALLLGITLPTLHKYSITGKVPAYRIARQVRYKKSEVEKSLLQFKTFPQDQTA